MLKNLTPKLLLLGVLFGSFISCASSIKWEGEMNDHVVSYNKAFDKFRALSCKEKTESTYEQYLRNYRGQGYWIPELDDDVDVESIKSLLPQFEKKLSWIKSQREKVKKEKFPSVTVTNEVRSVMKKLLRLKRSEIEMDEAAKTKARQESLKLLGVLQTKYKDLINKVSFFTNYSYPVDHLKNRKVYDQYREKEDKNSVQISNYTFLYRKTLEDGAYNKDHTGSDIYLRTTLDTLHYELQSHDFYLTEDARYDMEFVLSKIESELKKGKDRILERLQEWEERSTRTLNFYEFLTQPENQKKIKVGDIESTPNRELIKQHNHASDILKDYVYTKQAEAYKFWLGQSEINKAIFVLETILLNEVGGVDGDDALERMDVARVVMNRLDKPKYLLIGKKEFLRPYLNKITSESDLKKETWLNALFKQGEFSFTYYYMSGVAKIFCPDMAAGARKLRKQNVEIALQVLKEGDTSFKTTRYFSRASMIGRIHMDSVWEDYIPYPERPGLLASGQEKLKKAFAAGDYTYLYSFKDPAFNLFQVVEINGSNYAIGDEKGIKLFFHHRNPHYFRYFTKTELK